MDSLGRRRPITDTISSTNMLHAIKLQQAATLMALLMLAPVDSGQLHTAGANNRSIVTSDLNNLHRFSFWGSNHHAHKQNTLPIRCGRRFTTNSWRIVGGRLASITDFPWMVSLQREKSWFGWKAFAHSCGGSLLTSSWIITAAHCLYNHDEPLRVIAGTDNMNFLYRAQIRMAESFVIHPEFDNVSFDNDVALIKVDKPFQIESTFSPVRPICLERDVSVMTYDIATICGFGAKSFHSRAQTRLFKTEIAIVDRKTCNASFDDTITRNMICAGGMVPSKRDACSGDSGGPLMLDSGEYMTLIGLVSFGNDCATKGYPGIYTKLANYHDWIVKQMDEDLISP